jgi:hypothetical protein
MTKPQERVRGTGETLLLLLHAFEEVELSPLDRVQLANRSTILAALRDGIELVEHRDAPPWPSTSKGGKTRYRLNGIQTAWQESLERLARDVRHTLLRGECPSHDSLLELVNRVDRATWDLSQPETFLRPRKVRADE